MIQTKCILLIRPSNDDANDYSQFMQQKFELTYVTRLPSPESGSHFRKCARTPFQRIRRKERLRKERINLSLTPTKHDLSILVGKQSDSFYESLKRGKQCKTDRESLSPSRFRLGKEGNYRVIVKDNLHKKTHSRGSPQQKADEPERRLIIEGANCGSDLLALNRHKLEQMIAQIKVNNNTLHEKYDISEVVLEKGKYTRNRQNEKKIARPEGNLFYNSQCRPRAIDSREYLICSPVGIELAKNELSVEGSSAIGDGFNRWQRVFALSSRQAEQSRKICKTEEMIKSHSPRHLRKTSPTKKGPVFNGFNLQNLKGWDSTEQPQETFFQLALR